MRRSGRRRGSSTARSGALGMRRRRAVVPTTVETGESLAPCLSGCQRPLSRSSPSSSSSARLLPGRRLHGRLEGVKSCATAVVPSELVLLVLRAARHSSPVFYLASNSPKAHAQAGTSATPSPPGREAPRIKHGPLSQRRPFVEFLSKPEHADRSSSVSTNGLSIK